MSEKKLTMPKGMKTMAIGPSEPIGAKPNVVYATCCAPCAIYSYEGAEGVDCLLSVVLCLFCWPGACCHGCLWAQREEGPRNSGSTVAPSGDEMVR